MLGAILSLVANALAVIVVAYFLPNQVSYADDNWMALGIFALVVGVLNAVLRPIVRVLTAPIGCVTLGLFSIVINGLMFWIAAQLDLGVDATFLGATITALAAGLLSGLLGSLTRERESRRW
jgi:putative membrane protein